MPFVPILALGAGDLQGPRDDAVFADASWGIDFEAGLAVVTGDVARVASAGQALDGVRLLMLCNAWSLRELIPAEVARGYGAERVLLLPGDCPLLNPREIDRLLGSVPERFVAIVPDRHGTGTNALLLSPPDAIEPAFGEGSAQRHLGLAREAGIDAGIEELPSLGLDLDTPGDIVALETKLQAGAGGAKKTAKALDG